MKRVVQQSIKTLLPHTAVVHPDVLFGAPVNVQGKRSVRVHLLHALVEAAANTNPGVFRIQGSPEDSGNSWLDIVTQAAANTGTPATEAFAAAEPAGETVIAVALTAGFTAGLPVYIQNAVVGESELGWVKSIVANVSVTLVDGLQFAQQQTTSVLWTLPETFTHAFDLDGIRRLRVGYLSVGGAAANSHVKAIGVFGDSIIG